MEVLGRVDAAGAGAESWIGRRVCAIPGAGFGGYAELAICPAACAFEMPEHIPDADAAAIFFPFHLSHFTLFERGRLARGESVLIHAAAGGIGSAAVQLAREAGARVFATAGSDDKLALCRELGADVAINYRKDSFADLVNDATGGRGVDVVFDSVGGDTTAQSYPLHGDERTLLVLGFASGIEAEDEPSLTPRPLCSETSLWSASAGRTWTTRSPPGAGPAGTSPPTSTESAYTGKCWSSWGAGRFAR
jgi:NADPH2:quinone reductase